MRTVEMGGYMRRTLALVVWTLGTTGATWGAEPPPASLDREAVPASGTQSALVTVSRFGRYAITVTSAQGTSLQLVDRMAGPGDPDGEPGVRDGRLDLFLDRGQYKLVTRGHRAASGTVRLAIQPFREKSAPTPARLVELKP